MTPRFVKSLTISSLLGLATATAAKDLVLDELFSLPYGNGDAQIGIWIQDEPEKGGPSLGPRGIAVGAQGEIAIADSVNKRVIVLNSHGRLIGSSHRNLFNLSFVAIGPDKNVFAVWGDSQNKLTCFTQAGTTVWTLDAQEAIPQEANLPQRFGELSLASDGTLVSRIGLSDKCLVISPDGKAVGLVQGKTAASNGLFASAEKSPGGEDSSNVVLRDKKAETIRSITIRPVPLSRSLRAKTEGAGFGQLMLDGRNNIYRVWNQAEPHPVDLRPNMRIGTSLVIMKFSPEGSPVAEGLVPGSPFGFTRQVAIDSKGNLYHLAFRENHVSVVRITMPNEGSFYSFREAPVKKLNGLRYVLLRAVAQGYETIWDKKSQRLTVVLPGTTKRLTLSIQSGGLKLINERVWISEPKLRSLGYKSMASHSPSLSLFASR